MLSAPLSNRRPARAGGCLRVGVVLSHTFSEDSFMRKATLLLTLAMLAIASVSGMAQSTTGTIRGKVVDLQNLALPGVTVNVSSPNLQGVRTVVTSESG